GPIAGTGSCCYTGDGGPALSAAIDKPWGFVVDASGRIYFKDAGQNAVRELVAGSGVPTLLGVVNGATNLSGPIAPGEVVVFYGNGLGPVQTVQSGIQVLFNGSPGTPLYSSEFQAAAVAPGNLSGSNVEIDLSYGGLFGLPVTVPLASAAPGIFTADNSGHGQAAALNADGSSNSAAHPATGSITLFATGVSSPVQVTIAGVPAPVLSQNQASGVLQVTAKIPAGIGPGAVPVVMQSGGVLSPTGVSIVVGP
ncbi:MAG: hypothetical protein JO323_13430, partial [Acidobacteriia bacterium]|nr:hypothetical protein [Terriglobia bacterium]